MNAFSRTERLLGAEAMERLASARVAVFGIGGVGGHVCEALVRSGVGAFELVDRDIVSISNLNRQIIALRSTIGRWKTDVMRERMLDINPDADIRVRHCFFLPENASEFSFGDYDYVVDAVDTVTAKLELIVRAKEAGTPVISAMGAGNKLDPSRFRAADIYDTRICPLARIMRRELRKRGIRDLKVVYSEEEPVSAAVNSVIHGGDSSGSPGCANGALNHTPDPLNHANIPSSQALESQISPEPDGNGFPRRSAPGSIAFAPAAAGLVIAAEVIRDLCGTA